MPEYLITAAAIVLESVFVPKFLVAQRPGKSLRSLIFKMICSTCFLIITVCALIHERAEDKYAMLILTAVILSWFGDLFLHIKGSRIWFAIGFTSFLAAHVVFIFAFQNKLRIIVPEMRNYCIAEAAAAVVIFSLFVLYLVKGGMQMPKIVTVPICIYALAVMSMCINAVGLAVGILTDISITYRGVPAVLLAVGGICFLISDFTLLVLMFHPKHKTDFPLKIVNIATYFVSVSAIGLSLYFVN